jgi:hypothetical protein
MHFISDWRKLARGGPLALSWVEYVDLLRLKEAWHQDCRFLRYGAIKLGGDINV